MTPVYAYVALSHCSGSCSWWLGVTIAVIGVLALILLAVDLMR